MENVAARLAPFIRAPFTPWPPVNLVYNLPNLF